MNSTAHLSRAERIQRIGALLAKGVALMLSREAEEKRTTHPRFPIARAKSPSQLAQDGNGNAGTGISDETGAAIIDFLRRTGGASPRDVQRYLSVSKATTFRKLDHLVRAQLVTRSGTTTATRYQLSKKQIEQ